MYILVHFRIFPFYGEVIAAKSHIFRAFDGSIVLGNLLDENSKVFCERSRQGQCSSLLPIPSWK